eukprot:3322682-Pyramimonas_sp.AAC.1
MKATVSLQMLFLRARSDFGGCSLISRRRLKSNRSVSSNSRGPWLAVLLFCLHRHGPSQFAGGSGPGGLCAHRNPHPRRFGVIQSVFGEIIRGHVPVRGEPHRAA